MQTEPVRAAPAPRVRVLRLLPLLLAAGVLPWLLWPKAEREPAVAAPPPAASAAAATPAAAPGPHRIDVVLKDGSFVGSSDTLQVRQGEDVELQFSSDRPLTLHLHGYEVMAQAGGPEPGILAFKAELAGRFPVHEHREGAGNHRAVFFIEVHP